MLILFNNRFIKEKEASISMLSESFMYGYGVFETLRTYGNKSVFKAAEHIDRLLQSAKLINLKLPHPKRTLQKMLEKISQESPHKLQRIKIIAVKEGILITSIALEENPKVYEKGVTCKTINCQRHLPKAKTLAYLNSYLSHEEAVKAKAYEAILIDKKEEVYEGAYSNLFWFEKDTLCTRKTEVLEGITRETVIKISPFKVKYKKIHLKDLLDQKEIFLTQTSKGIVPITKIDHKKINNGKVGPNTKKLIQAFTDFTQQT